MAGRIAIPTGQNIIACVLGVQELVAVPRGALPLVATLASTKSLPQPNSSISVYNCKQHAFLESRDLNLRRAGNNLHPTGMASAQDPASTTLIANHDDSIVSSWESSTATRCVSRGLLIATHRGRMALHTPTRPKVNACLMKVVEGQQSTSKVRAAQSAQETVGRCPAQRQQQPRITQCMTKRPGTAARSGDSALIRTRPDRVQCVP
ncbi:hypothetical protein C7974DRAFT_375894 [Boeremia exigua]|uniref:uncharacterized protein n=1 Tax=Boeremia exigua TaxID=749465 RepID=UPI001E8CA854|nr:uncharacterized protein C7974DRAFT_375894 [Boeremia exigua]KAH6628999.1 hypothetical protein C7974DRAFT_375894 [Boeremia exigua]